MSNCKFCGQPAGFLRHKHSDCQKRYDEGRTQIVNAVSSAASELVALDSLPERIDEIAHKALIPESERKGLLAEGWSKAVDLVLHDGVLEQKQEESLVRLKDKLGLSQDDLDKNGSYMRVAKAAVIRDVLNGILPQRVTLKETLPLNLHKDEQIVWAFTRVDYLEDRTRRQYVGGSRGVSVRIAKGVYYRVGAFKGEAIDRTVRMHVDSGILAVTNKNIYFCGPAKSLRVPYSKIVSFQPFNDGVGITRDTASAKPQIFVTGDGWFTYNLVTNLAHLQ